MTERALVRQTVAELVVEQAPVVPELGPELAQAVTATAAAATVVTALVTASHAPRSASPLA